MSKALDDDDLDAFLYGSTNQAQGEEGMNVDEQDGDEESDDDIEIVLDNAQARPPEKTGTLVNLKHQPATTGGAQPTLVGDATQTTGQANATVLDLDAVGEYKGRSIFEMDTESFDDKPWRKPGADITDYFNYGFDENSWRIYSSRQKQVREDKSLHEPSNPEFFMGLPSGPSVNNPIAAAAAAAAMRNIMAMRGGYAGGGGGGRGRGGANPQFPFPMDPNMWNAMQQQQDKSRDSRPSQRDEPDYRRRYGRSKSPSDHYHRRSRH